MAGEQDNAAAAAPALTFITVSDPDEFRSEGTRTQIRRLAMTQVGLARRKPRAQKERNEMVLVRRKRPVATSSGVEEVDAESSGLIPTNHNRKRAGQNRLRKAGAVAPSRIGLDTLDPFACLQVNMDSEASNLCHSFFGTTQTFSDELRTAWSYAGFYDDMAFQTFLSNSALYLTILRKGHTVFEDTSESLHLHTKALSMLCQKLDDPTQHTSDSLIGGMSGFLVHDYVIGDFVGWHRHMGGLLKMLELRRKSVTFDDPRLSLVLSWADITGCFSQDIPPHLPIPLPWLQSIALPLPATSSHAAKYVQACWNHEFKDGREWLSIYTILCHLIHNRNIPINMWIEAVLHRLLSLRPLWPSKRSVRCAVVEEVCRIGTLLFLAPMWRLVGIHPVRTDQMRQNLLNVLEADLVDWGRCRVILLWTLAHAVRESQDFDEQQGFAAKLVMVSFKMQLFTWPDIRREIEKVLCWEDPTISWLETETAIHDALLINSI